MKQHALHAPLRPVGHEARAEEEGRVWPVSLPLESLPPLEFPLINANVDGGSPFDDRDPANLKGSPSYFVLLDWRLGSISQIRDFRHARYIVEAAEIVMVDQA